MHNLPIFDSQNIGDNSVFDPSQSMYIEASAGTGKTYTIQQIVARMIHDGTRLNLSEKDQKWLGLGDTFKF